MIMKNRVYDSRTNATLFEGEPLDCAVFISTNFDEQHESFPYIWMEEVSTQ